MVHNRLRTTENFAADLQRMSRQFAPGTICAPTWVKLRTQDGEEQLHWGFDMGSLGDPIDLEHEQWQQVRTARNFLQRFLKLADSPSKEIERFAQKYGVLAICQQHGLPVSHQDGCLPLGFADDCHEPLRLWREHARRMRAIHDIARELRMGNLGADSDWRVLHPSGEKSQPFENVWVDEASRNWRAQKRRKQLDLARFHLREEMDQLLRLGDVGLRLEWQRGSRSQGVQQPGGWMVRLRYGHWLNLFGALVVHLLLEITDTGEELYLCSGCGRSYTRSGRRPNAGQNNYCQACQNDKVPLREADLRRRRRMQQARVLDRQGVSLDEIAQRLHTKPDHVARWLTKRVRKSRKRSGKV